MALKTEGLRQRSTHRLLVLISLLGLVLLLIAHDDRVIAVWLSPLVTELGLAFVIAAILGAIVDRELKQGLLTDAVEAALGYLLPAELKSELKWIYGLKFMAEQHFHVRLEHLQEERAVILHATVSRRIENVSNTTEKIDIVGGTEEWFVPGHRTSIVTCEYRLTKSGDDRGSKPVSLQQTEESFGITYGPSEVILAPGDRVEILFAYKMPAPDHGMTDLTFRYPIRSPEVTVEAPESLKALITISHRSRYNHDDPWKSGYSSQTVRGVLIPHQPIILMWHQSAEFDKRAAPYKPPVD